MQCIGAAHCPAQAKSAVCSTVALVVVAMVVRCGGVALVYIYSLFLFCILFYLTCISCIHVCIHMYTCERAQLSSAQLWAVWLLIGCFVLLLCKEMYLVQVTFLPFFLSFTSFRLVSVEPLTRQACLAEYTDSQANQRMRNKDSNGRHPKTSVENKRKTQITRLPVPRRSCARGKN